METSETPAAEAPVESTPNPESEILDKITLPRVERVELYLSKDPVIKPLLEKKKTGVIDGKKCSKQALDVAIALVKSGKDPYQALKGDILDVARRVLQSGPPAVSTDEGAVVDPEVPKVKAVTQLNQSVAILSLLLSAKQIVDATDTFDGVKSRQKSLGELVDAYAKLAHVQIPSKS
jgi:hypothetical protein